MSSTNRQAFLHIRAQAELKQKCEKEKKKTKEPDVIIEKDHIFVNSKYVCKFPLEEMYRVVIPNTKIKHDLPLYAVQRIYERGGILIDTDIFDRNEYEEFEKYVKNESAN